MRVLDWISTFFRPYTLRDAFEEGRDTARKDKFEEGRDTARKDKNEWLWDTPARPITPTPDTVLYQCHICEGKKPTSEMKIAVSPHGSPHNCCKNCWHMTGEAPFFTCYLCHQSSPYHEMIPLTSKVRLCEPCDINARRSEDPSLSSATLN